MRSTLSLALVGGLLFCAPPSPAAGAGDAIAFLHLRWTDGQVTLVEATVRPGKLKAAAPDSRQGRVQVQLTDAGGKALWEGSLENPGTRRIEVPPPADGGQHTWIQKHPASVDVVLRTPALAAARELRIIRAPGAAGNAQAAGQAQPAGLVTRIPLPKLSPPGTP